VEVAKALGGSFKFVTLAPKTVRALHGCFTVFVGSPRLQHWHYAERLSAVVSKSRYINGTFSVVGKPFRQLLSVHCFIKGENCVKQVTLTYVLMSCCKVKDCRAVLLAAVGQVLTCTQSRPTLRKRYGVLSSLFYPTLDITFAHFT